MTAHRIYTVTTNGCRTLESEFAGRNDLNALRLALEAVSRLPREKMIRSVGSIADRGNGDVMGVAVDCDRG